MNLAAPAHHHLLVYVPKWVRNILGKRPDLLDTPFAEARQAAVLFLDIADFSEITSRFATLGRRGAEELSNLLNDCFDRLTVVLEEHGADIVAFAGDSIVAIWDGDDVVQVTQSASQCALHLQDALAVWGRDQPNAIRQRISIEFGDILCCKVGGLDGQWLCIIVGSPLERIGDAYWSAQAGDVILCEAAYRAIADVSEGVWIDGAFRLARLTYEASLTARPPINDPPLDHLGRLVPKTLSDRLAAGSGAWGEFRNLTILQIALHLDPLAPAPLAILQRSFLAIQIVANN